MPDDREVNYNRIFILGGKDCAEEDLREAFEKYGTIKDVYIVKDRKSGEPKGIVYITYSKSSEAALAIEEMNAKSLPNHPKPVKVLLAADRREGAVREPKEDEKLLRLFIMVPRTSSEADIKEKFEQFGEIEYVRILTDRQTGDSKGLAYVKYYRAYHAALALENCDSSFKPVFASNRVSRPVPDRYSDRYMDYEYAPRASVSNYSTTSSVDYSMSPHDMIRQPYGDGSGECCLEVMASTTATPEQLRVLMDLIPGFEYCDFDRLTGVAYVRYSSPKCAAYAKDKLNGFEYPTGYRLSVRYPVVTGAAGDGFARAGQIGDPYATGPSTSLTCQLSSASDLCQNIQSLTQSTDIQGNLQELVHSIEKATAVLQQAGIAGGGGMAGGVAPNAGGVSGDVRVRYCNVPLPEKKAYASRDSPMEQRLFIVSQPESFQERILQDAFCRFGNLIDAYFMPGRNYGYAKFASHDSAQHAISTLHGQQICGMRLKVLEAEPPKHDDETGNSKRDTKRPRT